jgi:carbonic anhydrase
VAILGCSDSRVPVEIVFDVGLGDVFVIRVAGNFLDTATSASLQCVGAPQPTAFYVTGLW